MGKGDKKSRRGKIILGSYGVRRRRKNTDKPHIKLLNVPGERVPGDKTTVKEKNEVKVGKPVAEVKETKVLKEKTPVKAPKAAKEKKEVTAKKSTDEPKLKKEKKS